MTKPQARSTLAVKAFLGFAWLILMLGLSLFLPAWTLDYREAWTYLCVFAGSSLVITIYFLRKDPELIGRRLAAGPIAEKERRQKVVQSFANLFFLLLFVIAGLDHRFHWSVVSTPGVIAADFLVALGFLIVFLVFRENSFTSGIIEVSEEQRVISTGPYSVVRHPMYSGALLLLLFTPIALGSLWALPLVVPMLAVIAARLLHEEEFLTEHLQGYREYCRKTRYRLFPGVW